MPDSEEFDARPVRTFLPPPGGQVDESVWPASVPAMAQVLREGLELPAGLTVLVGENGTTRSRISGICSAPARVSAAMTVAGRRLAAWVCPAMKPAT